MSKHLIRNEKGNWCVVTEWKKDAFGNQSVEKFVDVSEELRTYLVGELDWYGVKAIGLTPEDAIRALAVSKEWGAVEKITDLPDGEPDPKFPKPWRKDPLTWARRFLAGGTSFKAAGHEVPGGYALTWWK